MSVSADQELALIDERPVVTRNSNKRNLAGSLAGLLLGIWLALMLISGVVAFRRLAETHGWTDSNPQGLPLDSAQRQAELAQRKVDHDTNAIFVMVGLGSSFLIFPAVMIILCLFRTKSVLDVFLRLRWTYLLFAVAYVVLGNMWQDFYQDESPIDVSSDAVSFRVLLFSTLFGITFLPLFRSKKVDDNGGRQS